MISSPPIVSSLVLWRHSRNCLDTSRPPTTFETTNQVYLLFNLLLG